MKTFVCSLMLAIVAFGATLVYAQEPQPVPVPPPTVQEPPDWLPFGSVGELQAYAWERVSSISLWAGSSSSIRADGDEPYMRLDYNPAGGVANVDEILGLIGAQDIKLEVLHTENSISLYGGLYSQDGHELFWGGSSSAVVLPRTTVELELQMGDWVWNQLASIRGFYIVERDAKGNPVRYYNSDRWQVDSAAGGFYFPAYFAGKSGEIVITLSDGHQVAYSLNNGKRVIPTKVQVVGGKVSVWGTRTFVGQHVYLEVGKEELEKNVNPLCQVTVPSDGYVDFAAWIGDWKGSGGLEYASYVRVWAVGQRAGEWMEITTGTYLPLKLGKGLYWAEYWFKSGFGRTKNRFNPPYNDGGGRG